MGTGIVEGIFVATVTSGPIERVEEVSAVAGAGLKGDRTWQGGQPALEREAKIPTGRRLLPLLVRTRVMWASGWAVRSRNAAS